MSTNYEPPFKPTNSAITLVSEISELVGKLSFENQFGITPILRRENRLQTIQASLAIENNTLTLEQVTDIIDGKRVLGNPREIQEVKNAFAAYELIEKLNPYSEDDLLTTHSTLMHTLIDDRGKYRLGGVGILKGKDIVHMAPPALRVPLLMQNLFFWLKNTTLHPLISSSVFHYEFEFIHPFSDGNGRMGRLWQTLILSKWKPIMAFVPIESVIRLHQDEYYRVLGKADQDADSTGFVEFLLRVILVALTDLSGNDQDSNHVSDQVKKLLQAIGTRAITAVELMQILNLSHRNTFRKNYLHPALDAKLLEMTIPEKPNSRLQKYRITTKGLHIKKLF